MAHHGRAGKNSIPAANSQKTAPDIAPTTVGKKARGRTAQTTSPDSNAGPNAREGNVLQERLTEVNNPIGRGGGKMRGDRQNMTPDPGIRGDNARMGKRQAGVNKGLRNDRNPQSTAGRRNNRVANEGG
jgi:hypothetical protein